MILEEETFKKFGYCPSKLTRGSHKRILAACDECENVRETSKNNYHPLCNSCAKKGRKRKPFTEEHKRNLRAATSGNINCLGYKHTEKAKANMSAAQKKENNGNWQGGLSFEPYCVKFNPTYKREIRKLFSNRCFLCSKTAEENGKALDVHHVNYNKNCGCDSEKCICVPLCRSCHMKTNYNRKYWEQKIKNKLRETLLGY